MARRSVLLPGNRYLEMMRENAMKGAQDQQLIVDRHQRDLSALAGQEGRDAKRAKKEAQDQIDNAKETIKDFQQLVKDLDTEWKTPESRNAGHVVYSPPIDKGNKSNDYTMGWALYEVDPSKIKNFSGNVIDLGQEVSLEKLKEALDPNIQNPYKLVYPASCQWEIENIRIPLDEMRYPKKFDQNNSPALSVLKRGRSAAALLTRLNLTSVPTYPTTAPSYPRNGPSLALTSPSLPSRLEEIPAPLVVDAEGRMGGMLTGGSGFSAKTDVTYATPMVALLQDMHKHGWKR